MPSPRIRITETMINEYTTDMQLLISSLEKKDFGEYFCRAESTVGRAEEIIRLSGTIFTILGHFFHPTCLSHSKVQPLIPQIRRRRVPTKGQSFNHFSRDVEFSETVEWQKNHLAKKLWKLKRKYTKENAAAGKVKTVKCDIFLIFQIPLCVYFFV